MGTPIWLNLLTHVPSCADSHHKNAVINVALIPC